MVAEYLHLSSAAIDANSLQDIFEVYGSGKNAKFNSISISGYSHARSWKPQQIWLALHPCRRFRIFEEWDQSRIGICMILHLEFLSSGLWHDFLWNSQNACRKIALAKNREANLTKSDKSLIASYPCQTFRLVAYQQDPFNNVTRTAIEALGCRDADIASFTHNSLDEAIALSH